MLTQPKVAIADDCDFEFLIQRKWYAHRDKNTFYARAHGYSEGKPVLLGMHRVIMQPMRGLQVDHINGNGLDNCRCNLRICTSAQNQHNYRSRKGLSKYKGVSWHRGAKKWQATIQANKKRIHLGCHDIEEDAALAYDKAALHFFGEFARINFSSEILMEV